MGTLIRDGVKIGGTTVYVDSNLSTTSENPVENKIVTSVLNEKANTSSLANVATTGSYNDLSNKPEIDTNLSTESTNAVQNKVITNSLDEKYPIDYDVALSLAEWEALGDEKYYNHKNYYIYDAGTPTEKTTVYGWHVDPNESDPSSAITYLKNAVGMTPASMGATNFNYGSWQNAFFMPKPCMVKENGEVDYYLDENDYTKKKDTITITSSPVDELPLSFNSDDNGVINYHIYGTENGAGVETENLFDKATALIGYRVTASGVTENSIYACSDFIEVIEGEEITVSSKPSITNFYFFTANKSYISYAEGDTATVPSTAKYVRCNLSVDKVDTFMLVKGATVPTSYILFGYKIPILNTSGVTENLVPEISTANGWRPGYINSNGSYNPNNTNGEWLSPYIDINITMALPITIKYKPVSSSASLSLYFFDANGDYISKKTSNTNGNAVFTTEIPTNATKMSYAFRTYCITEQDLIQAEMWTSIYAPYRYEQNYNLYIGDTKLGAEEYLDYAEQKVYKWTENLFDGSVSQWGSSPISVTNNGDGSYTISKTSGSGTYPSVKVGGTLESGKPYIMEFTITGLTSEMLSTNPKAGIRDTQTNSLVGASVVLTSDGTYKTQIYTAGQSNAFSIVLVFNKASVTFSNVIVSNIAIYKIQPTEPPVPFPTINTYQGENTLSSTETLGKISIYAISDIANLNYNGNAMMEWPLIFWKYESGSIDGEGSFYVSNRKIDDTYNCWCNYDSKNNIISNFYTAIYNGGIYNGKLRSMSGYKLITKTSTNYSNTSTYAINDIVLYNDNMYICITDIETPEDFDNTKWLQIPINGGTTTNKEINSAIANNTTSDVEWYIDTWSDRMLINGLLILMGKSLNSQATFGRGLDTGEQTAKEAYITGYLNDKGLFWGDTSVGTSAVKVFGMENLWGCVWRRTAGLIGLANGNTAYKMTYGTADGTTANGYNKTGDGYHINTITRPSANYVKSCKFGNFGYLPISTTGGSSSTYYTDYWYPSNSALTFALVGGYSNFETAVGVSYFYLASGTNNANWSIAAALTLKPLIE